MKPLARTACFLALALSATSCFTVEHFTGDPAGYDGLYFGPQQEAPPIPAVQDDKWRNYAVYGLVPWDEAQIRFAGRRLAQVPGGIRPLEFTVTSEQTFLNGLTNFGLALLTGGLGALFFAPRSIEVTGWPSQ